MRIGLAELALLFLPVAAASIAALIARRADAQWASGAPGMNVVHRVNLSGGLLGALFSSPKRALQECLARTSREDHEVVLIRNDQVNLLQALVYGFICLVTLLLWCPAPGYLVVTRPRRTAHAGAGVAPALESPMAVEPRMPMGAPVAAALPLDAGVARPSTQMYAMAASVLTLVVAGLVGWRVLGGGTDVDQGDPTGAMAASQLDEGAIGANGKTDDGYVEDEDIEDPTGSNVASTSTVMRGRTVAEVALAWRARASDPKAAGWRVVPASGAFELRTSGSGAANALVPALVAPEPALNIRMQPSADGRFLRTMPPGTVAVALYGVVDGQLSIAGDKSSWTYVVAAPNTAGWSSSTLLEPARGCVPDSKTFVASIPPEARAAALDDVMLAKSSLHTARSATPVVTWLARDSTSGRSFVALHSLDPSCRTTAVVAMHTLPGLVEHTFAMDAADGTGPGLLAIGWKASAAAPDDPTQWEIFELGSARPIYSTQLVTDVRATNSSDGLRGPVTRGPRNKRGYWPLRVLRGADKEYYRWEGGRLVREE